MIPTHWTFSSPVRLLLLLVVAVLAAAYLWQQRQRRVYERRLADEHLLPAVLPSRPGWRRHLPAGLLLLAMVAMTTGFARPSADVRVPRETATIVIALDTSGSMQATDVSPSRLEAAKAAAEQFVAGLPRGFAVGLVSFSSNATIQVAPTREHGVVSDAIANLQIGGGTAIGDAVAASVQTAAAMATASKEPAPVHIVLLSDGSNTAGRSVHDGIVEATRAAYPVSTIAYGTQDGIVNVGGYQVRVPVDTAALAGIAEDTGGTPYVALTGGQLKQVYREIAQQVGTKTEHRDITGLLVGLSVLTAFSGAAGSLVLLRLLP